MKYAAIHTKSQQNTDIFQCQWSLIIAYDRIS